MTENIAKARIATFNVNSIRARLDNLTDWLTASQPDIVLLQEVKATLDVFPFEALNKVGYHAEVVGQKSYNGVAILSREPVELIRDRLPGDETDAQARWIEARWRGIHLCGLYLPNGNPFPSAKFDYKLDWMRRLHVHLADLMARELPLLAAGDFNLCPEDEDAWDAQAIALDALVQPEVRDLYYAMLNLGLTNALRSRRDAAGLYSYWDYQGAAFDKDQGLLIDHILLSPELADRQLAVGIDRSVRAQPKASDHTPVWVELSL